METMTGTRIGKVTKLRRELQRYWWRRKEKQDPDYNGLFRVSFFSITVMLLLLFELLAPIEVFGQQVALSYRARKTHKVYEKRIVQVLSSTRLHQEGEDKSEGKSAVMRMCQNRSGKHCTPSSKSVILVVRRLQFLGPRDDSERLHVDPRRLRAQSRIGARHPRQTYSRGEKAGCLQFQLLKQKADVVHQSWLYQSGMSRWELSDGVGRGSGETLRTSALCSPDHKSFPKHTRPVELNMRKRRLVLELFEDPTLEIRYHPGTGRTLLILTVPLNREARKEMKNFINEDLRGYHDYQLEPRDDGKVLTITCIKADSVLRICMGAQWIDRLSTGLEVWSTVSSLGHRDYGTVRFKRLEAEVYCRLILKSHAGTLRRGPDVHPRRA
ncbi:hypothetical protein Tco_1042439 [Tanacetum coccineum]|uniref:Uncharacterized protein n=1 Tax=Tanacetum coccineum TaxID=301880 RepID=A0ABQ5GJU7_9ASTR